MKKNVLFFLSLGFILWSFKQPQKPLILKTVKQVTVPPKMPEIMLQKGCNLCHSANKTIVGPSFKTISLAYKDDRQKLLNFLNGKSTSIVNPAEFSYMKPVLNQLKKVSLEEKKKIVDYILSFK